MIFMREGNSLTFSICGNHFFIIILLYIESPKKVLAWCSYAF